MTHDPDDPESEIGKLWMPIETAPRDETKILLAHIRDKEIVWAATAAWGTASPGYIQCASYSGWFAALPMLCDPVKGRNRCFSPTGMLGDIICETDYPPTHWMPLEPVDLQPGEGITGATP